MPRVAGFFYWEKMKILTTIASLVGVLFIAISGAAMAMNGVDLQNCRFKDGSIISSPLCEKLRVSETKEVARKEKQKINDVELESVRQQDKERRQAEKSQVEESYRAIAEERAKKEAAIDAKWAEEKKQRLAEEAQEERAERDRQNKRNADIKSKKEICGADFGSPKIGMTFERAQQCVSKFRLSSQINRSDGVISMYSGGGFYINVMDGRIVAWTR